MEKFFIFANLPMIFSQTCVFMANHYMMSAKMKPKPSFFHLFSFARIHYSICYFYCYVVVSFCHRHECWKNGLIYKAVDSKNIFSHHFDFISWWWRLLPCFVIILWCFKLSVSEAPTPTLNLNPLFVIIISWRFHKHLSRFSPHTITLSR